MQEKSILLGQTPTMKTAYSMLIGVKDEGSYKVKLKNMMKQVEFLKKILTLEEFNEIQMDESAFKGALGMYEEDYIDSVNVFAINNKRFIIKKSDSPKLHKDWEKTLEELSLKESLLNPVYVEVDSNGVMLVE